MNESGSNLVTTYAFKGGKEYVVKMKVLAFKRCQRCLELTITDKFTAEDWRSSYDTACSLSFLYFPHYERFLIYISLVYLYKFYLQYLRYYRKSDISFSFYIPRYRKFDA